MQGLNLNKLIVPGQRLYPLSFEDVLNNAVALSSFIGTHLLSIDRDVTVC